MKTKKIISACAALIMAASSVTGITASGLTLKEGNYEKWIDRAEQPDFAYEFYDMLIEASDNDGENDFLINPYVGQNLGNGSYGARFTVNGYGSSLDEIDNIGNEYCAVLSDVYMLFSFDHPEVFWLSDFYGYMYNYSYRKAGSDKYEYIMDIDVIFKNDEYNVDIRRGEYNDSDGSLVREEIQRYNSLIDNIIEGTAEYSSDINKIEYFNNWLVMNNEYNTYVTGGKSEYAPLSAWSSISALEGSTGHEGPVCEGYAKAFKVLCDAVDIPCVINVGTAAEKAENSQELHMWNLVSIGNDWYGVDITWNDPVGKVTGAVSGFESGEFLLVGDTTLNFYNYAFSESHITQNMVNVNGMAYTNGPVVCSISAPYEAFLGENNYNTPKTNTSFISDGTHFFFKAPESGEYVIYSGEDKNVIQVSDSHISGNMISDENGVFYLAEGDVCYFETEDNSLISVEKFVPAPEPEKLEIIIPPENISITEGKIADFKISANGEGLTYQWYWKSKKSNDWAACAGTGYNTDTLSVEGTMKRDGYSYYCIVRDEYGNELSSETVYLDVTPAINIASQPSDINVKEGETAEFTVLAEGDNLKYKWYWKNPSSSEFKACTGTGYNTDTLSVEGTMKRDGYQYYCKITNSDGVSYKTNVVSLSVTPAIVITSQPSNIIAKKGQIVDFTVSAEGEELTYQWYWKSPSSSGFKVCSGTGYNTNTLSVEATLKRNGYTYYCVIKDKDGRKIKTSVVYLTLR